MIHTILELKLVEALMDVCSQRLGNYFNTMVAHDFMSDGEQALGLLEDLGFAETEDQINYKLRYDKLADARLNAK